jgi:CRP/FNR family transcriptional regulator, cyclic AMP receptor protein
VLIEEGGYGDTIYIIISGALRAHAVGDKGQQISYGINGPGEYLGEMSVGRRSPSASCSAVIA